MSGGTEGGLFTAFRLVLEARPATSRQRPARSRLAARARKLAGRTLGRLAQVDLVAEGVRAAMRNAGSVGRDVHFAQIKCPLLTADRVAAAEARAPDDRRATP